jgi:tetratricopeptide (TPR) repeat protein
VRSRQPSAAAELAPDDADAQRILALVSSYAGRHDDAVTAARRAVGMDPLHAMSHVRLVEVLVARAEAASAGRLGRLDAAEARRSATPPYGWRRTFRLRTTPARSVAHAAGELADADADYGRALALDPHRTGATSSLAVVRSHRGRLGGAGRLFRSALAQRPTGGTEPLGQLGVAVLRGLLVVAAVVGSAVVVVRNLSRETALVSAAGLLLVPAWAGWAVLRVPPVLRRPTLAAVPRRAWQQLLGCTVGWIAVGVASLVAEPMAVRRSWPAAGAWLASWRWPPPRRCMRCGRGDRLDRAGSQAGRRSPAGGVSAAGRPSRPGTAARRSGRSGPGAAQGPRATPSAEVAAVLDPLRLAERAFERTGLDDLDVDAHADGVLDRGAQRVAEGRSLLGGDLRPGLDSYGQLVHPLRARQDADEVRREPRDAQAAAPRSGSGRRSPRARSSCRRCGR